MFSTSTMFSKKFFAHENMEKTASKVAKLTQIQPESQFLFHKNLPPRDFSIMTLLAGMEGVLPVDLAMTKNNTNLQAIVAEYSKVKGIDLNMNSATITEGDALIKYSEVDNILLAVNADEYLPAFKKHQVDLTEFLLLNESDLVEIGVAKVGLRKKMLDVIADMHKRQWEKSSVPKVQPRDKQNGIYFSAPDGALLISTVGHHLKLLNANVEFLARHIREKPQMLQLGNDVASIEDIARFTLDKGKFLHCQC